MELNDLIVRPCTMGDVRQFIEKNHYSHSIQGVTPFLCFEITSRENIQKQIGAAVFGMPGQSQTERKYGEFFGEEERPKYIAIELRRLALLDELPKNSESKVLGILLQRLKNLGVDRIISYADPNQIRDNHPDGRHTGLIYKATGFHKALEAGKTKAFIVQKDFTVDGKTFKSGRRLPIRNWDQYQNFAIKDSGFHEKNLEELKTKKGLEWLLDWEQAVRDNRAVYWMRKASGHMVYVIKTEKYLTSLSRRVREGEKTGALKKETEEGKILWIKDLKSGMPYFETPKGEIDGEPRQSIKDRGSPTGMAKREAEKAPKKSPRVELSPRSADNRAAATTCGSKGTRFGDNNTTQGFQVNKIEENMDLNTASTEQLEVYRATVAKTMGIDPLMLDFIWMNDPETGLRNRVLYAKRGACEILRHELKVSVTALVMSEKDGLVTFMATGTVPSGRQEMAVGSAYIEGLRGDKKAHGIMTAQTRAVRRLTLQFVTGGILDETEVQAQTDVQIASAASGAALAGSPMVIPTQPLTAPTSAPGRDITPTKSSEELANEAARLADEFTATQQALRDEAKAQLLAKLPVSTPAETPAPSEIAAAPAKIKRTRKARNTVSIASPGQTEMPVGHIDAQGKVSEPPSPAASGGGGEIGNLPKKSSPSPNLVSTPAPPAPVPLSGEVAVEKAQPAQAQTLVAPPPSAAAALSPEKATEFKNRLRVYANDVLPKGGMLPTESIGGVTMKLRAFAAKHTGATDTTALGLAQWEDLFDFLDSYTQKNGPAGLVAYIDKAIGATK